MSSTELTLWAWVEDLDPRAVECVLWQDFTLVRTWAIRGTLHLLPADELRLWQAALSTSRRYLISGPAAWQEHYGVTMAKPERLTDANVPTGPGHTGRFEICTTPANSAPSSVPTDGVQRQTVQALSARHRLTDVLELGRPQEPMVYAARICVLSRNRPLHVDALG